MAKRIAFIDGFEDYPGLTTSGVGVSAKWAYSVTSTGQPTLHAGRVGGRPINLAGNSCLIHQVFHPSAEIDRKSVGRGKMVSVMFVLGGLGFIQTKTNKAHN